MPNYKYLMQDADTGQLADRTLLQDCWPVGSIFISVVPTNPSTLLGFGTWSAFGAGRALFGLDGNQTEFDTAEKTGGSKSKTLSITEIPSHNHGVTDPGHTHSISGGSSDDTAAPFTGPDAATSSATAFTGGIGSAMTGISIQNSGGGQSFSILPPYIVCYFWERTA